MTQVDDTIEGYLRFCSESYAKGGRTGEWAYNSPEALVLAHGRRFVMKPKPDDVEWGQVGYCYANASEIAMETSYVYCEGYATGVLGFPLHHAWLLDPEDGLGFDVTWRVEHDPRDYLGVEVSRPTLARAQAASGLYAVLPVPEILREPWRG